MSLTCKGLAVAVVIFSILLRQGAQYVHDVKLPLSTPDQLAYNTELEQVGQSRPLDESFGLETLCYHDGFLYGGSAEGDIVRFKPDVKPITVEHYAYIGGRPLGCAFDAQGDLLVAEPTKGLLKIEKNTKRMVLLANQDSQRSRISYANGVAVASDGIVYFSDSSLNAPIPQLNRLYSTMVGALEDGLDGRPTGRLLAWDPQNPQSYPAVLMRDLSFANGVALSADDDFVVVAETYGYCLHRYFIKGPKAGTAEMFAKLPGMPDGLSRASDGGFWVAFFPASPSFRFARRFTWIRALLSYVGAVTLARVAMTLSFGNLAYVDKWGNVTHVLSDPHKRSIPHLTSVVESDGFLYTGSLYDDSIGVVPLQAIKR